MTIYAADVANIDFGKVAPKKETEEVVAKKEKKPRTEAQIAGAKKAAEARKLKKLELERVKKEVEENEKELERLEALKKTTKKRKSKEVVAVQESTPSVSSGIGEAVEQAVNEPVKKKRAPRKPKTQELPAPPPEEPPMYFKKYVEGMLKAQNDLSEVKKPAKQIKTEAVQQTKDVWANDVKRDCVKNEVDKHMNRMYSMMFSRG